MSDVRNLFSRENPQNCCREYLQNKQDMEKYSRQGFYLPQVFAGGKNGHLHSDILKFLLDPEEELGQNDTFLHKFITFLNNEHNCKIDLDHYQHAEVTREKYNIDVLTKGNKHAIRIEDKVSGIVNNQPNQICRYYDDVKKDGYEVDAILYLTKLFLPSSYP